MKKKKYRYLITAKDVKDGSRLNKSYRYLCSHKEWIVVELLSLDGENALVKTNWYGWPKEPFYIKSSSLEIIGRTNSKAFVEAI